MKRVIYPILLLCLTVSAYGAVLVYDEFDGVNRAGWNQVGLGEWAGSGSESGGMFMITPSHWVTRTFDSTLSGGKVWYALTLRVDSIPIGSGEYGTVSPSSAGQVQWMELGFQYNFSTTQPGFPYTATSGIDGTTLQTLILEIDFSDGSWKGWAATGTGSGVDTNATPLKTWPPTSTQTNMNGLYLSTGMNFEVDRVCIADTLAEAYTPIPEPGFLLLALSGCVLLLKR